LFFTATKKRGKGKAEEEKLPSTIKHKAELALQKKYLPQFTKPLTKLLGQPTQFHEWPVHLSAHIVFLIHISFLFVDTFPDAHQVFICQLFSLMCISFSLIPVVHQFFSSTGVDLHA
jgi:hypothetical protein